MREGTVYQKPLDGDREICVYPRIFNATLTVGCASDEIGYDEHYCYENPVQAIMAAEEWLARRALGQVADEPEGWFRHKPSNRRRPGGDPEKEYIAA